MANTVDGVTGSKEITEKWRCHFEDLLNSKSRLSNDHVASCTLDRDYSLDSSISVTSLEIDEAIKKLKVGKAPGYDNISSEHLKYAHDKISVILSIAFNTR